MNNRPHVNNRPQQNRWIPLSLIISYAVFAGASYEYFHEVTAATIGSSSGASHWVYVIDGAYVALTVLLVACLCVWLLRLIHSYERTVEQSEARFRDIIESTPDMVWESSAQFEYTLVSPMSQRLLGRSPEEMLGKTPFDFMPEDIRASCRTLYEQCAEKLLPIRFQETEYHRNSGGNAIVEVNATPVLDAQGALIGYRGIDRDITERRHAEGVIVQTNEFYRALFDRVPVPLWRTDADGRLRYLNTAAQEVLEMSLDQLVDYSEAIHPEDRERYRARYQHALDTRTRFSLTYRLLRRQQYYRYMTSIGVPCWDSGGRFIGFVGYFVEHAAAQSMLDTAAHARACEANMDESLV